VRAALRRWHPWDPLLVATPGATRMRPPICIAGLDREVQARTLFHYRLLLGVLVLWTLGFGFAGVTQGVHTFRNAAIAGVMMLANFLVLYVAIFRPIDTLRENSRFVVWVYTSPSDSARNALIVMLLLGALQFWLQRGVGGLEALIVRYGLVFDVAPLQPWRYISGPLMHSGIAHWVANVSLLLVAISLVSTLATRVAATLIFAAGTILPALLLTFLPYAIRQDAFLGISGGLLALMGWLVGIGWRERAWLPRHFAMTIGMFSILFVILSTLLSPKANDFVHLSGLLIGVLLGLVKLGWKHQSKAAS
jgi:membrane associated rhomboid family serine protease